MAPIQSNELKIVLRIMPDDNSCLFRAIGFVLDKNISSPMAYREKNKTEYNEVILGKPTTEYAEWICKKDSWGGAIELAIFSQIYETELVAFDVIHMKTYVFGEGKDYKKRAYLLYSGIHYDAIAGTLLENSALEDPNEFDVTLFSSKDSNVFADVFVIAQACHDAGDFTDTARYVLQCQDCGLILEGNTAVQKHAEKTGHVNFEQVQ